MKFIHAGVVYALANVASAAVPMLLLPILTRVLSPTEYGQVVAFALIVTLTSTVAGLNAHAALGVLWFKLPRDQMPAYTGTAIALAIGSTIAVAPFAAAGLWVYPNVGAGIEPMWGAAAALTAGANVLVQCRLVLWQSQQRPLPSAALQVCASAVNVGLSLLAVLAFGLGSDGRNGGIAVAASLMACISIALFLTLGEVRWGPDRRQLATYITFGCPLILHAVAGFVLATADRWTVSIQLGPHLLGVYGAGAQLGMVMTVLADAFVKTYGPWLYGKLASAAEDGKLCAVGAIYVAMPAFVCAAIVVGVTLHWISSALLGPQYRAATGLLPWFMVGGAFTGIYMSTSVLYFFSGRTALLSSATLASAALGAAATWPLVSAFGVDGAAMGFALTQALLAMTTGMIACASFDLPWREPRKGLIVWYQHAVGRRQPV